MTTKTSISSVLPVLSLCAFAILSGCMTENKGWQEDDGCCTEAAIFPLVVHLTNQAPVSVEKLAFRTVSNLGDTVQDTLLIPPLVPDSSTRLFHKIEGLRPLRWWNIEVWTLGTRDTVLDYAIVGPFATRGGVYPDSVILNFPHFP